MSTQPSAIWILDCTNFIEYLEMAFESMADKFPQLVGVPVNAEWNWRVAVMTETDRIRLSLRDEFINWIIREQLERIYLFTLSGHYRLTEYQAVFNHLLINHDLDRKTTALLPIPQCRGSAELALTRRVAGALIVEYHRYPKF